MSRYIWLLVGSAYAPSQGTDVPIYLSTARFNTKSTDTPAGIHFLDRLREPGRIKRTMFSDMTTKGRGRIGSGNLVIANGKEPNGAGELDGWVNYGWDGRTFTLYYGLDTAAFPAGFTVMLTGEIEQAEFALDAITLKWRDMQAKVNSIPLQAIKYAGNNALPDGLEGVADLKGKPKPRLRGKVRNVSPPCVNTSKLIYQVNDGAISSVSDVRDSGVSLGVGLTDWTAVTSQFGGNNILGIGYGNGVFVATGASKKISTSTDGVTWTARTSNWVAADNINFPVYVDATDRWLAVGYDSTGANKNVASSSDSGATWTIRTTAITTPVMRFATYAFGLYIVVGDSGSIQTSPDLVTWTSQTSGFGASHIYGVVFDGTTLIACGQDEKISRSTDGTTWTLDSSYPYSSAGTRILTDIAYQDGTYVMFALSLNSDSVLLTSTDGVLWVPRTVTDGDLLIGTSLAFGQDDLIFGASTRGSILYSNDTGVSWAERDVGVGGASSNYAAYGGGRVVVGGNAGNLAIAATNGTYASEADLLDDSLAPAPGTFKYYAAGGYFRLGSTPVGQVTADVLQGANTAARTAGQLFAATLDDDLAFASGDWSAPDITTADSTNSAVCGSYVGTEERMGAVTLDAIAASVGAGWWPDADGVLRLKILTAPSAVDARMVFTQEETRGLQKVATDERAPYRTILSYSRNYTVQTGTSMAGSVSDADRALYAEEWQKVTSTDATVQTKHPRAPELDVVSLLAEAADAATEVARVQTLRGTDRDFYTFQTPFNAESAALDLGDTVLLQHQRFGLSTGKPMVVIGIETVFTKNDRDLRLEVWG